MKKIIAQSLLLSFGLINAQAFKGNGDVKGQVGLNVQNGGTGIFYRLILELEKTCH
jgi:outer membrane protein G